MVQGRICIKPYQKAERGLKSFNLIKKMPPINPGFIGGIFLWSFSEKQDLKFAVFRSGDEPRRLERDDHTKTKKLNSFQN